MRITQWGEYGVHFAVYLARQEKAGERMVSAAEVAEAQGIDLQYAQQILQRLRKGGIVESVRGPQGGYHLKQPASEVSLRDILLAMEGETFELFCDVKPLDEQQCNQGTSCGLRTIWSKLRDHVDEFLEGYSLEELAKSPTGVAGPDSLVSIGAKIPGRRGEALE